MIYSIWLNAWDLAGRSPGAVIDELRGLGLNGCHVGLSYHGGRMLLPRHPVSAVYEQHPGAVYFRANLGRFGRLWPAIAREADEAEAFLEECSMQSFPVYAWTVLCHNDGIDADREDCCMENAFGDRYRYALCPANPDVAVYARELCRQIGELPGVVAIDLEALSFLGYPHQSLHDKRGAPLSAEAEWLLSLCFCPHCCAGLGDDASGIRRTVQQRLRRLLNNDVSEPFDFAAQCVVEWRKTVLLRVLSQLPQESIHLRIANDYLFSGGKAQLLFSDLSDRLKAVTLTALGRGQDEMTKHLNAVPPHLHAFAGISILQPDVANAAELAKIVTALQAFPLGGLVFYHYGLANDTQLNWLRQALRN